MKILIHCGHYNMKTNCRTDLRSGTGAPGEAEFNWKIGIRLEKLLQEKGFSTYLDDANTNCHTNVTGQDWNLALAIHADANIYGTGGGFVDVLRPDWDKAREESARIAQALRSVYFKESGIVEHPERANKNTSEYYLWSSMSDKTPCVIIECGVLKDAHDSVILNDTERVAQAIAKGILKAFPGVVVIPPTDPCGMLKLEVSSLEAKVLTAERERNEAIISRDEYKKLAEDRGSRIDKAKVALS